MADVRYRNGALFSLLAVLLGSVFVAIEVGLRAFPTVFFAALRCDIAVPLVLAYSALLYGDWLPAMPAIKAVVYGLNPLLAPVAAECERLIGPRDPVLPPLVSIPTRAGIFRSIGVVRV